MQREQASSSRMLSSTAFHQVRLRSTKVLHFFPASFNLFFFLLGIFATDLHRPENDASSKVWWIASIFKPLLYNVIGIPVEQAASSVARLATSQSKVSGEFFHGLLPRPLTTELANDEALEEFLWKKSVELTQSDIPK